MIDLAEILRGFAAAQLRLLQQRKREQQAHDNDNDNDNEFPRERDNVPADSGKLYE